MSNRRQPKTSSPGPPAPPAKRPKLPGGNVHAHLVEGVGVSGLLALRVGEGDGGRDGELTKQRFAGYVSEGRPLLIQGAMRGWPAMQSWRQLSRFLPRPAACVPAGQLSGGLSGRCPEGRVAAGGAGRRLGQQRRERETEEREERGQGDVSVSVSSRDVNVFSGDVRHDRRVNMPLRKFVEYAQAAQLGNWHPYMATGFSFYLCQQPLLANCPDEPWLLAPPEHSTVPHHVGLRGAEKMGQRERAARKGARKGRKAPCWTRPVPALQSLALADDVAVPAFVQAGLVSDVNLWLGVHSARSTLHYDANNNLLCVVKGAKHVLLIAPRHTAHLYPCPVHGESINHSRVLFPPLPPLPPLPVASGHSSNSPPITTPASVAASVPAAAAATAPPLLGNHRGVLARFRRHTAAQGFPRFAALLDTCPQLMHSSAVELQEAGQGGFGGEREAGRSSGAAVTQPAWPRGDLPTIIRVTVREGEMLFIPEGWWHQVDSEKGTVAVNMWFVGHRATLFSPTAGQETYFARLAMRKLVDNEKQRLLSYAGSDQQIQLCQSILALLPSFGFESEASDSDSDCADDELVDPLQSGRPNSAGLLGEGGLKDARQHDPKQKHTACEANNWAENGEVFEEEEEDEGESNEGESNSGVEAVVAFLQHLGACVAKGEDVDAQLVGDILQLFAEYSPRCFLDSSISLQGEPWAEALSDALGLERTLVRLMTMPQMRAVFGVLSTRGAALKDLLLRLDDVTVSVMTELWENSDEAHQTLVTAAFEGSQRAGRAETEQGEMKTFYSHVFGCFNSCERKRLTDGWFEARERIGKAAMDEVVRSILGTVGH